MNSAYQFYEVVTINSMRKSLHEINGQKGAVLGKAQDEKGEWFYSVHIFETEISWHVAENELVSTGTFLNREDFYNGGTHEHKNNILK